MTPNETAPVSAGNTAGAHNPIGDAMIEPQCGSVKKNIAQLLALPSPGKCKRYNVKSLMKRKDSESKHGLMDLGCGCWSCRPCADRMRMRAGRYVAGKLLLADGVIFESASTPDEWASQRKRLKRLKASWVRFGATHLPAVIIGVAPSQFGVAIVDRERAIIRVGEALRAMRLVWREEGSHLKPIGYSDDWTPPEEESKYEMVDWVSCKNPAALVDALHELGVCARLQATDGGQFVAFDIPPDMDPEAREKLKRILGCPRIP